MKTHSIKGVREIYRAYLDLIEYLEEKFPGGVSSLYGSDRALLLLAPCTVATVDEWVLPACRKFNNMKSTQITVQEYNAGVTLCTAKPEPALYTLHAVARDRIGGLAEQSAKVLSNVPPEIKLSSLDVVVESGVELLKAWMQAFLKERVSYSNLVRWNGALYRYWRQYPHKHADPEAKYLRESLTGFPYTWRRRNEKHTNNL